MGDETERQHYVPRHLLKQFTIEGSNTVLWCYDKEDRRKFKVSVSKIALENHFYDSPNEDSKMESWLERLEGRVAKEDGPLPKLLDAKTIDVLQPRELCTLAVYIAVQELRTKLWRDQVKNTVSFIEEKFGKKMQGGLKQEVEDFQTEESLREFQNEFLRDKAADAADMMIERLSWHVTENKTDTDLWLSDHPVVRHNTRAYPKRGGHGLLSKGVEIYFPLSPNLFLHLLDKEAYSTEIKFMPGEIYDEGIPIFMNDIQVQNSRRHIFSKSDDFSLAERRLTDTPEVGDPDRNLSGIELGGFDETYREWDESYDR